MRLRTWLVAGALVPVGLIAALAMRDDPGDLEFSNRGSTGVTVFAGDEEFTVTPDGGVVLLDYGCTPGDVTVEFPTGRTVILTGPVCPDERIVIQDDDVQRRPVPTSAP